MFSLSRTFLQHEYLVQTVSCKEQTHGHGHTNQIPWVNIYLADQQLLSHVSCGFVWDEDHLRLQRSTTTLAWSVPCMQEESWGHHKCQIPVRWQDVCCQLPTEHS